MTKIYTRTGDDGETGLVDGSRVSKDHPRVAAYGDVDELNAALGVVRAELAGKPELSEIDETLDRIQHRLFDLGAELATPSDSNKSKHLLAEEDVTFVEQEIDRFTAGLEPLREFILPGGTRAAADLHLARCICRRAERSIVSLYDLGQVRPQVVHFVNRLSDLLFVLARVANLKTGVADVVWRKGSNAQD